MHSGIRVVLFRWRDTKNLLGSYMSFGRPIDMSLEMHHFLCYASTLRSSPHQPSHLEMDIYYGNSHCQMALIAQEKILKGSI